MVLQKPNPFPPMSIYDSVASGLKLAGIKVADEDDLVETSLRRAGLWTEVSRRLGSRPHLDQRIEDTIAELRDQVTIVIVTHNRQQAARVSQKFGETVRRADDHDFVALADAELARQRRARVTRVLGHRSVVFLSRMRRTAPECAGPVRLAAYRRPRTGDRRARTLAAR